MYLKIPSRTKAYTIATTLSLFGLCSNNCYSNTVVLDGQKLLVQIDTRTCRWSAELKGTNVKLDNIHFLDGDNPNGWKITSSVHRNDSNALGHFETITLHGAMKDKLDFDYHISVSKTGTDIIVCLDRANRTGFPVELDNMDYFVVNDARLGGTTDKWVSFGTKSQFSQYYELNRVCDFPLMNRGDFNKPVENSYEVCHLVKNTESGNCILMGHLTVHKGHSRFEVNRKDATDAMRMQGWCAYNITVPDNKSFEGEKLLIRLGNDGLRDLEHLGDMIALANDIRLKEKRPLDLNDTALISHTHCQWSGWASGGKWENADKFIRSHGLNKFYYSISDTTFGALGSWGLYYCGGKGEYAGVDFPEECYLPIQVKWGNGKVADFSNPLAIAQERNRVKKLFTGKGSKVNVGFLDFSENWDKWSGQHDPFMSAVETWRAAAAPWRDAIDSIAPRLRNKSCMSKVDFNYGFIENARISEDADGMFMPDAYFGSWSFRRGNGRRGLLGECVPGAAMRFFYNTRVYWNDGDNFHVYKYDGGRIMPYDEAKVTVNFKAMATTMMNPAEAFDCDYPEERIELMKRVAPPTDDAAYPVDLFERQPAAVWNMPVKRSFGKWCILGVFNYGPKSPDFSVTLHASEDLRLDPEKEYIAYEFWTRKLIGTFKGTFTSRAIGNKDCDIYAIVEKQNRPVLISTSRHVRQMAFDIKDLKWDNTKKRLNGVSRSVEGDPYQLRIYLPQGWRLKAIRLPAGLKTTTTLEGNLLTIDYTTPNNKDVVWNLYFDRPTNPVGKQAILK